MDLASKVGKHLKLLETFDRNTKVYTFEMRVMDANESFAGSYRCEVMLKEKFDSCTFELLVEEAPEPKQVMDIRAAFRKVSTTGEDSGELDFSGLLKKREQKVEASEPDEDVWELLKGANPQEYERIAFEHGVTDLRGLLHRLKRMKQEQRKSEVFLKRLDPAYQAVKGGRVRLAVDLEDPNTEIKWFKNGTEIRSSGKFIMEAQGKRRILTINHCSLADDAAYEVMVGDEKCSTELFVREPPVHIVRDLDDQSCLVGDRIEFFCEVSEDGAQVKWLKDGKELSREESSKFRFKKDGPKHQLIISDVCQEDNGRYSVVTSGGETHAELHVEEKPLKVIRGMADLTVNARDLAVFRCEVSEERVSGRWYKDGREVRPSEHVCISHVGRIHKLEIDGVRDDDKGDYTFVPDGHAFSLSAKLNMLEVKIDFVPRQEPPKIHLEPLEGLAENTIVVVAGNKLRLDLPISGDPTPTVIWHRGQQVISASQGRVHVESFPDHSTFVVECAERGDEDCYSIVVRNDAGEDSAQLNVKVVDVPDPPSTPSIVVLGGDWCLAEWEAARMGWRSTIVRLCGGT
uniref:Ig-like domain-containing protein n=1 Tax=Eptatretus burgeri TaxID=7764 RepID=A0A8C4R452_EPTBU